MSIHGLSLRDVARNNRRESLRHGNVAPILHFSAATKRFRKACANNDLAAADTQWLRMCKLYQQVRHGA